MSSLKQQTIHGLTWSFIDHLTRLGVNFVVGIILARLLSPREFGLIGMLTIFISVSESFIKSGFEQALIRKKNATNTDFSTVFYFNMLVGILFFLILYFSAPAISRFFNEPKLIKLLHILGIVLIVNAFTIIQRTILTRNINFKLITKISAVSSVLSGIIGIYMAHKGFGVWSLVIKTISQQGISSMLLWFWSHWRPTLVFSKKSFLELFNFGYKLLLSGLLNTLYKNIYYLIIGRYYSAETLGFYTRAQEFKSLPSNSITSVVSRVSYPILSKLQDEPQKLKYGYKKIITGIMFITFVLMFGMAAVAEPLIIIIIGEQWRTSVRYLQLLCFVGMMYPLHALNLNILNVKGRSDLFLKLEIIKKVIVIPVIIIGLLYGIEAMIIGMILNTHIAYYLNSYWSGKLISYPVKEQIRDILPSLIFAAFMSIIVYFAGRISPFGYAATLFVQVFTGALLTFAICELIQLNAYLSIKEILQTKLSNIK